MNVETEIISKAIFVDPTGKGDDIRICCNWCSYEGYRGPSVKHPDTDWFRVMIEHFQAVHPRLLPHGDPAKT